MGQVPLLTFSEYDPIILSFKNQSKKLLEKNIFYQWNVYNFFFFLAEKTFSIFDVRLWASLIALDNDITLEVAQ